ncbi:MAG: tRNA lysidine(34) synthetase TilS [Proteiniphilum sp.]|jgi:tRNA(Ile)-lysidine synthase|nr:tRNA lysidine(34) synthetase TilS [Proteiniphilum sp.]NCB24843.1 tRNA lysidine(34) synthetase TilS [Bacteroidia bacterium]MDD2938542.1 tRNA lysidine(34) synthetase TilS [Proteiniphilum sp.]MDD3076315.1 tRNA lysidine(34) synthetase TilS [Proteiniphilum sp.]MDD3779046.1 tRNA lysidine(34) synthetase TilS [Proteiniphilum sp.]
MLDTIRTYIQKEKLLSVEATVIVGLSGGMDSMALLDILTLLGYRCVAAHCNFHLRGAESDRDGDFVRRWCKSVDVPLVSIDFDTREYASDRKISIEMAARELRYRWFEMMRVQHQAEAIAVAHHRDDSVETVLMNLIRGTGIKGLSGIAPKNRKVVRPLLSVSREEIARYMVSRDIPYVFDSSNNDDLFLRNALRLHVIPTLEELNPAVKEAIYRTAQHVAQAEKVYNAAMKESMEKVVQNDRIDVRELRKTPSPQSLLFELLTPMGFGPSTIQDICSSMDAEPGKIFLSRSHRVIKDRDYFLIDQLPDKEATEQSFFIELQTNALTMPLPLTFSILPMPITIERNKRFLYADFDQLRFPLTLRKWRQGDWFIPFGMKGRKKLSDYFTDRKFSLKDKEAAWVLLSGEEIVWIVGERPDERYRIREGTLRVFHVSWTEDT